MKFKLESSISFCLLMLPLVLMLSGGLSADAQTNAAISIDDVSVVEGDDSIKFIGEFLPAVDGAGWVEFHSDGNLYVSSAPGNSVLRYDASSGGFVDAFVTPGNGGLDEPHGFTFGIDGNLYVTSQGTDEVLRFEMVLQGRSSMSLSRQGVVD